MLTALHLFITGLKFDIAFTGTWNERKIYASSLQQNFSFEIDGSSKEFEISSIIMGDLI